MHLWYMYGICNFTKAAKHSETEIQDLTITYLLKPLEKFTNEKVTNKGKSKEEIEAAETELRERYAAFIEHFAAAPALKDLGQIPMAMMQDLDIISRPFSFPLADVQAAKAYTYSV